uniref:Kazal-like domain-containing protein n=1 Tax=Panagrellus redivivus TaxID=6233 RepID=A0A7E4VLL8_PANRE
MIRFAVVVVVISACLHAIQTTEVAKQVDGNVQLVEKKTTKLVIQDEHSFTLPNSCVLCYEAQSLTTYDSL